MNRADLKQRAKAQLGGSIFGSVWLYAVLVFFINALTKCANISALSSGPAWSQPIAIFILISSYLSLCALSFSAFVACKYDTSSLSAETIISG